MTEEELAQYPTAAERMTTFKKDFIPEGYYMEGTYKTERVDVDDEITTFEVKIFKREGDKIFLMGNGFGQERRSTSAFNHLYSFQSAQTKARSQALASIGILVEKSLATRDEISENQETLIKLEKKEKESKMKPVKEATKEETLKRLRLKYEKKDGKIIVSSARISDKTKVVLKKHGFEEIDKKWSIADDTV